MANWPEGYAPHIGLSFLSWSTAGASEAGNSFPGRIHRALPRPAPLYVTLGHSLTKHWVMCILHPSVSVTHFKINALPSRQTNIFPYNREINGKTAQEYLLRNVVEKDRGGDCWWITRPRQTAHKFWHKKPKTTTLHAMDFHRKKSRYRIECSTVGGCL